MRLVKSLLSVSNIPFGEGGPSGGCCACRGDKATSASKHGKLRGYKYHPTPYASYHCNHLSQPSPPPPVLLLLLNSPRLPPPMELSSWATYLATILASIFFLLLLKSLFSPRRRHCKLNLPPGPKPWPVIGNLNLLGSLPHRSLHALSQKYGPLMHLYYGSFPVIVASSVDTAKLILKTHDVTFCGRPKTAAGRYTTYNYSDIAWSQYGPYWRQARKICMMELFSARRLDHYQYIRVEEVKNLLRDLFNSSGRPVNFHDHLSNVSFNIISRMVLGKKYLDKSEGAVGPPEEFKAMFGEFLLLNGVMNIGDSIPWLDFLDLQGYIKRMKKIAKKFDRFLEHVLDEHNERRRREGDKFVAEGMVDVLLQLVDDPDLEVKLERRGAKAIALVGFSR